MQPTFFCPAPPLSLSSILTLCTSPLKREALQPNYATMMPFAGLLLATGYSTRRVWFEYLYTPLVANFRGACPQISFTNLAAQHLSDM